MGVLWVDNDIFNYLCKAGCLHYRAYPTRFVRRNLCRVKRKPQVPSYTNRAAKVHKNEYAR
jgi:hypothetical protein